MCIYVENNLKKCCNVENMLYICTNLRTNIENNMEKSLWQRVVDMKVGDTFSVPVSGKGFTTLKSYASEIGMIHRRKYSTHLDRESRTYHITRVS